MSALYRAEALSSLWTRGRVWCPGSLADSLVEQQVRAGGEHFLQAGLAHGLVRNPEPLRAERRRAPAVRDEVSGVRVAVVHQHRRQPEQVLR